jgi:protein-S-isoprenylcysteine O-methyltransferase Ste14
MSVWLKIYERKLDFLWVAISIGLAIVTWRHGLREPYAPIWLYVILHVQAAMAFALRHRARASSKRPLELIVTFASLNHIFVFDPVPIASAQFAAIGGIISTIGALLALVSIHCLGRSFAILPSLRIIQTSGMYGLVRHPIYMSYLIMEVGILIRHPTLYNAAVALVGVGLMLWRIQFEERFLQRDQAYAGYVNAVRYRLIPRVY